MQKSIVREEDFFLPNAGTSEHDNSIDAETASLYKPVVVSCLHTTKSRSFAT